MGLVGESSTEEVFTGPVTLTAPAAFGGAAWEICGPWTDSGAVGNHLASRACLLVASPSAPEAPGAAGERSVVRVERGEYQLPYDSPIRIVATSTWVATPTGGRIEETWTFADAKTGAPLASWEGRPLSPVAACTEVRWDLATHTFAVTPPACPAYIQAVEAVMGEYALARLRRVARG